MKNKIEEINTWIKCRYNVCSICHRICAGTNTCNLACLSSICGKFSRSTFTDQKIRV